MIWRALDSPIDPIIRTLGDVEIRGYYGSSLHILAGGSVTIGSAIITEPEIGTIDVDFLQEEITLSDGTVIIIDGGVQPTLDIRAGISSEVIVESLLSNISGFDFPFDQFFKIEDNEFQLDIPTFQALSANADIEVGDVVIDANNGLVLLTNQYAPNSALVDGDISITGQGLLDDIRGIDAGGNEGLGGAVYLDARSNIALVNSSIGTTSSGTPSDIILNAGGLVQLNGTNASPTNISNELIDESSGRSGEIRINANRLELLNSSQINSAVRGDGEGGNIVINLSSLEIADGAQINSVVFGEGKGSDIILNVDEIVRLTGARTTIAFIGGVIPSLTEVKSGVLTRVEPGGRGTGGNITLNASNLEVLDGATLDASLNGAGMSGNVTLNIDEAARFVGFNPRDDEPSSAFSEIGPRGVGSGGNVTVNAATLEVLRGAQLSTSNFGADGIAGSVILDIDETVRLDASGIDDTGIYAQIQPRSSGSAGGIKLQATNLEVLNGAVLSSSTFGSGSAGDIVLNVSETARFFGFDTSDGSLGGVFSQVARNDNAGVVGVGNAGKIEVSAGNLEITGGARLSNSSNGIGSAGSIILNVTGNARLAGSSSGVLSSVGDQGAGVGGNVTIRAVNLEVLQESIVSAVNRGDLDAGDILIAVSGQILVDDASIETASLNASGGRIDIRADNIQLSNDGDVQTFVISGEGKGGDISFTSDFVIALEDSDIVAFSPNGQGGAIDLTQTTLFGQNLNLSSEDLSREELAAIEDNGLVDVNAFGGISSGEISTNDASFIENSLNELSGELVDTATLTAGSCIVSANDDNTGSLVITGGEGLPQQPGIVPLAVYSTGSDSSPVGTN